MKYKTPTLLIAGITLLSPLFSFGQTAHIPENEKMEMHHEKMDDKYLPNAYHNKKTSPAYKYYSNGKSKRTSVSGSSGSNIFTIQVNVDSNGRNIIGDAANEPTIAVNPLNENEIVIGWRQFDNVSSNFRQAGWSYTSNAGQKWTFPGEIEEGVFRSDPVLDYDADGNFYYNSLTEDNFGNLTCQVFKSINGGAAWDTGTAAQGGDKQWMTIDRTAGVGSGNIYSSWTYEYSSCLPGFFTRSTNEDSSFENCTIVEGYPYWGTMAVGNAGELYIGGTVTSSDSLVVAKSPNAQMHGSLIDWNSPVSVNMDGYINGNTSINPVGLLGQVSIDVDRSNGAGRGNVYLLASMTRLSNHDPGDVMFAKSTDGGLTWNAPMRINDDSSVTNTQWLGAMSAAPNGRIDAVWLDTRDAVTGSDSSALYYSYSVDQGNTWSVNEKMSDLFNPHVGYPDQDKMGDYLDMVSADSGAYLAWSNTFNGEEDVYYSFITPPVVTGIYETVNEATFSIFPNPTRGIFAITSPQMTGAKSLHVEVYNTLGEKVYSTTISKTINNIDISSRSPGIYFLKVFDPDGGSVVKKIIKE